MQSNLTVRGVFVHLKHWWTC